MIREATPAAGVLTIVVIADEPQIRRLVANALTADTLLGTDAVC